jgi:hypothetical protein
MLSRKFCRVTMSALAAANVSRTETNPRPIIETNFLFSFLKKKKLKIFFLGKTFLFCFFIGGRGEIG